MIRIEKRLEQPWWLSVAVPVASIVLSFAIIAVVLAITGHNPGTTFHDLFDAAFFANGAVTSTLVFATPILFTGLAAAAAFKMQLFNIGGEGQFFLGAIGGVGIALWLGDRGLDSTAVYVLAMVVFGGLAGAAWAAIPAVLRAFFRTNEIITSLMLNYVAILLLQYLIIDSHSYWRDLETFEGQTFPLGKKVPEDAFWPAITTGSMVIPLGFFLGIGVAVFLWGLYSRTRFGFELQVIGDSQPAARYAGMRLRRKILAVMCLSGAIAGIGGASFEGDLAHQLEPTGLSASFYGYTGIVVAALARYNPFAVVPVAFLIGGIQSAGFDLQGADFPSGLVGVMEGIILFCALGGELFIRNRVRFRRRAVAHPSPEAAS